MKTKKLLSVVEDGTHTAVEYLSPYVEQALRESGEFADQTYSKLRPVLKDARIRGARIASDTFERVHPAIDDALGRVSPAVDATVRKVKPAVDEVLERIPPTVDYARSRVQGDLLPRLADLLGELAKQPLAKELRVAAASAALAKDLRKAAKPKRSGWRTFGKLLLAGAAVAAVAAAVRKLLADPSTGWENHVPSTAYVADPVAETGEAAEDVVDDVADKAADLGHDVAEKAADLGGAAKDVVSDVTDKVSDTADDIEDRLDQLGKEAEGGDASPLADSPYGEGSYVGSEPPEGYGIKGNSRSMKYHVPGSSAYERTTAEVWFNSEEAAQQAGFTRPQR